MPEYEDDFGFDFGFDFGGGGEDYTPSYDPTPTYDPAPTQDYSASYYEPAAPEQFVEQGGGGSVAPTGGDPEILPEGGFDMSMYAGQPQPQIDSSVTGEGAFAPGAQDPATRETVE